MEAKRVHWTAEEYAADSEYLRSTAAKWLIGDHGPAEYRFRMNGLWPRDETKPLKLGGLFDEYLLEGKCGWYVSPHHHSSNAYKTEKKLAEKNGQVPISQKDEDLIVAWHDAVMGNDQARQMIENWGEVQETLLFDIDEVPCKCRMDLFGDDGTIVDLKTTNCDTRTCFEKQIVDLKYDFSAAFYEMGRDAVYGPVMRTAPFFHIVLCKKPPFWVYVWELERSWLRIGEQRVREAIQTLKRCRESGEWPDRQATDSPIAPPTWYIERSGFRVNEF